jgi:hypothetical protein
MIQTEEKPQIGYLKEKNPRLQTMIPAVLSKFITKCSRLTHRKVSSVRCPEIKKKYDQVAFSLVDLM